MGLSTVLSEHALPTGWVSLVPQVRGSGGTIPDHGASAEAGGATPETGFITLPPPSSVTLLGHSTT